MSNLDGEQEMKCNLPPNYVLIYGSLLCEREFFMDWLGFGKEGEVVRILSQLGVNNTNWTYKNSWLFYIWKVKFYIILASNRDTIIRYRTFRRILRENPSKAIKNDQCMNVLSLGFLYVASNL